jgi:hypothetical protein
MCVSSPQWITQALKPAGPFQAAAELQPAKTKKIPEALTSSAKG